MLAARFLLTANEPLIASIATHLHTHTLSGYFGTVPHINAGESDKREYGCLRSNTLSDPAHSHSKSLA